MGWFFIFWLELFLKVGLEMVCGVILVVVVVFIMFFFFVVFEVGFGNDVVVVLVSLV